MLDVVLVAAVPPNVFQSVLQAREVADVILFTTAVKILAAFPSFLEVGVAPAVFLAECVNERRLHDAFRLHEHVHGCASEASVESVGELQLLEIRALYVSVVMGFSAFRGIEEHVLVAVYERVVVPAQQRAHRIFAVGYLEPSRFEDFHLLFSTTKRLVQIDPQSRERGQCKLQRPHPSPYALSVRRAVSAI